MSHKYSAGFIEKLLSVAQINWEVTSYLPWDFQTM